MQIVTDYQSSLDAMIEEFESYLNRTGINESLRTVLLLIYNMETKPIDPLEYL